MTSMREIARELGVSVAMVSRALSGASGISESSKARVLEGVREMGYRTNPLGGRLMSHYRKRGDGEGLGTLALLTATSWEKDQRMGRFGEFLNGVNEAAQRNEFSVDRFALDDFQPRRLEQVLLNRGIAAAVVAPSLESTSVALPIQFDQITCVLTGWGWSAPAYHRVAVDHGQAVLLALEQARSLCGPRVAALFHPSTDERARKIPSAVFLANHPMGFSKGSKLLFWNIPSHRKRLQHLLNTTPPDAILVSNPELTVGIYTDLRNPPACISLDGPTSDLSIGYIDQKYALLGTWAVEMLLSSLFLAEKGVPKDQKVLLVEPQWVSR